MGQVKPHLKLRRLRRRAELSQTAVAKAMGVHFSYVSNLERGSRPMSPDTAKRMREAIEAAENERG